MVIIENSSWWTGNYIFGRMLGPFIDQVLNHYKLELELPHPIEGQGTYDKF